MEAKPLRIVPCSLNTTGVGGGPQKKIDMGHMMEGGGIGEEEKRKRVVLVKEENSSSSTVELDIGVGASLSANPVTTSHPLKCCLFTESQRRELDHQFFIFNHFAYNLPLPHHSMSEYRSQGFDYGNMEDPEPHRCRRTDGKKWRCSKNVVSDQKYCERHMHRGRNRSRKPVETSQDNSPLTPKASSESHNKLAPNKESAVSNPNLLAIQPSDSDTSRSICNLRTSSSGNKLRNVAMGSADYHTSFSHATVVTPGSIIATSSVAPKMTTSSSMASVTSDNKCKKGEQIKSCSSNKIIIKCGGKGSIVYDSNGTSNGIGFSPRSVLQDNIVSGCNSSYINDKNGIEPEPGRCRRTDGKKWRCKNAILPGQKYCATHMHRGAKKRFTNHEQATSTSTTTIITSSVTIARLPYPSSATTNSIQKAYCKIPNTKLSMSVVASAPFIQCNEKSASSSDSDTTITDTLNECSTSSYVSF